MPPPTPQYQSLALQASPTFHLFRQLPAELRIKIWKLVFQPQHRIFPDQFRRPHFDPYAGSFLWTSFEAREIFLQNYKTFFSPTSRVGPHINYALDTLCLAGNQDMLRVLLRKAPKSIKRLRFIDIHVADDRPRLRYIQQHYDSRNLSPDCLITVRWDIEPSKVPHVPGEDPYGKYIINALRYLRFSLLHHRRDGPYRGPKVAAVFPRSGAYRHAMYFESEDLKRVRFGRIIPRDDEDPDMPQRPFNIKWIAKDVAWRNTQPRRDESLQSYMHKDLFGKLYKSRIAHKHRFDMLHNFREKHRLFRARQCTVTDLVTSQIQLELANKSLSRKRELVRRKELHEQYLDLKAHPLVGLH